MSVLSFPVQICPGKPDCLSLHLSPLQGTRHPFMQSCRMSCGSLFPSGRFPLRFPPETGGRMRKGRQGKTRVRASGRKQPGPDIAAPPGGGPDSRAGPPVQRGKTGDASRTCPPRTLRTMRHGSERAGEILRSAGRIGRALCEDGDWKREMRYDMMKSSFAVKSAGRNRVSEAV